MPVSYGFRPRRRAHDAIAEIHLFGTQRYWWVLDADIEACFDRIDHTALMGRVRARIKDKRVLALVRAFLKAGIMTELGQVEDTHTGTPQGGILSPLLANIALSVLDEALHASWAPGAEMSTSMRRRRRRWKDLGGPRSRARPAGRRPGCGPRHLGAGTSARLRSRSTPDRSRWSRRWPGRTRRCRTPPQRCTRSGEGETGVPASGCQPGGCVVDRLRWMLLGPDHRRGHDIGLGTIRSRTPGTREHQHRRRVVELLDGGGVVVVIEAIQAPRSDRVWCQKPLCGQGILEILNTLNHRNILGARCR